MAVFGNGINTQSIYRKFKTVGTYGKMQTNAEEASLYGLPLPGFTTSYFIFCTRLNNIGRSPTIQSQESKQNCT